MAMQVRRVVTGHDETGKSIIKTDELLTAVSRGIGDKVAGCEVWSTNRMPVDNSALAETAQRAGFVRRDVDPHNNYVRTGGGTLIRIIEWSPGHPKFTHRTETTDYIIILSGEIDLQCDADEVVHLKAGDVLVQRGGMHTWLNKGTVPAVMAAVLIDATPVEVGGKVLHTHFPDSSTV
jgi:uncharacterized cupin superfamily protein